LKGYSTPIHTIKDSLHRRIQCIQLFFATIDYKYGVWTLFKITNVVALNHLKRIIDSEVFYTNGREVRNVLYCKLMLQ